MTRHMSRLTPVHLDSADRNVLRMLLTGATQLTIARQMCMSLRKVEEHTARIRKALAASTLYMVGSRAVQCGQVDPDLVIVRAERRANCQGRVEPVPRQRQIVRQLADGGTYRSISVRLGICPRTVYRDFKRLADANGADTLVVAGALFEILGWHHAG